MGKATSVGDNTWLIDIYMGDIPGFAAVYALQGEEGVALVDTGVSNSRARIMESLREAGISKEEVQYIIVTHIHLDHAGGAGYLLQDLPNAKVVMAENRMEELVQPERLMQSARRALGAVFDMYGDMVPIDRSRMLGVKEPMELDIGGRVLRVFPTPGHATSHICVEDRTESMLFCGDALGMYLAEEGKVIPTTPPPDFDLEEQRQTLEALAGLDCGRTCFTHFGCAGNCSDLARASLHALEVMVETVKEGMHKDRDPQGMAEELMQIMEIESPHGTLMFSSMSLVSVNGLLRYFRK
jgi:glyoxylase-like metal-dependent hydrolase (beta-lactamase superfamily II)